MPTYIVDDNLPRNQYTATASQTVFIYDFVIEVATDLLVYQTPAGQDANDASDILQLNVDYTVTDVGNSNGGNIVLTVGANANDIITIQRDAPVERTTDFNTGGFTADQVNNALDRQTIFIQDNEMRHSELTIRYDDAAVVSKSRDLRLPVLEPSEFWQMNATGTGIHKAKLEDNADVNTLRSELADNSAGSDGSRIVGFESASAGSITVHDQLVKLDTFAGDIAQNTADIATNTANIATNTANIATNTTNIANNTTNIQNNADAIAQLQGNVDHSNIIIGGNFSTNPFQRRLTQTPAGNGFCADRFLLKQIGAVTLNTHNREADMVDFNLANYHSPFCLRALVNNSILTPAAGDYFGFQYTVEGYDFADIFEKQAVLQFFVKATVPGIYSVGFQNADASRFLVKEYVINAANTWQKVTIVMEEIVNVGTWELTNLTGLRIYFTIASGSTFTTSTLDAWTTGSDKIASTNQTNGLSALGNEFKINLVTLNAGTVAPVAYPGRFIEEEIGLCQRYYEQSYNFGTPAGTATQVGAYGGHVGSSGGATASVNSLIRYTNSKRASATINLYDPTTGANGLWRDGPPGGGTFSVSVFDASPQSFQVRGEANDDEIFNGHWTASSEIL